MPERDPERDPRLEPRVGDVPDRLGSIAALLRSYMPGIVWIREADAINGNVGWLQLHVTLAYASDALRGSFRVLDPDSDGVAFITYGNFDGVVQLVQFFHRELRQLRGAVTTALGSPT